MCHLTVLLSYVEICIKQHFPENRKKVTKYCNEAKMFPLVNWLILEDESFQEKISSCCLLRSHQALLIGGAGCDLGVGDPPVLHPQREGAVGGHWRGEHGDQGAV